MKKLITLFLIIFLITNLTGCGHSQDAEKKEEAQKAQDKLMNFKRMDPPTR
ncbi:hypothetical protein Meth11DRAFT_1387 [Methylophilaceae bacterium 11]|nr:hypothetical protein Meth11DRAFT_1387 [Methylophilaceae bacterium 11]